MMKRTLSIALMMMLGTSAALAQEYNRVPASDQAQYRQCINHANKTYEGGNEPSPIKGQNKAQAWCTCMWNETPDDFKGNLVTFSETRKGKETNKVCEKYSNWSE